MMFVYENVDMQFVLDQGYVNEWVIENKAFFREVIENLTTQTQGGRGKGVLSVKNTPVDMGRYAEMISTFVPFDINQKNLLTKICQTMEKKAMSSESLADTVKLMQEIEAFADELAFDFPCDLVYTKLSVGQLLKSLGVEIETAQTSILEKLLDYMMLVREFDKDKLFILVHLRSYFTDEEVTAFVKTLIGHDLKVLLIESTSGARLPLTQRCTIDEDLCEF